MPTASSATCRTAALSPRADPGPALPSAGHPNEAGPLLESRWTLRHRHSLWRRSWGDGAVVYNALAGSTHLLDPVAAAVLDCLWAGDRSGEAVATAVRCEFPEDIAEDVLEATHAALAKLRDIGLVRSAEE